MTLFILGRKALSDLRQHIGIQLMTTMVVSVSILIFVFFALICFNLQHFVERFGSELGLVVFLNNDTPHEQIPVLYKRLSGLSGVEDVSYISSEEAFERLENYLGDEKEVLEGVNPYFLPPSFEVRINRAVFQLERIRELAAEIGRWPEISKVQFGQEWIDRMEVFSRLVRILTAVSGLLLLFSAAFVVATTIKLTVYARQEEVKIMRLVGATKIFIQGPFLIEAFMQGLLGSCLAIGIVFATYRYLQRFVAGSGLLKWMDILFLPWSYLTLIVVCSVLLCVLGTALAMRRFLRL